MDVDVCMECSPGVRSNAVGDNSRKEPIEVEEEEDGQYAADQKFNEENPRLYMVRMSAMLRQLTTNQLKPACGFKGSDTIDVDMMTTDPHRRKRA